MNPNPHSPTPGYKPTPRRSKITAMQTSPRAGKTKPLTSAPTKSRSKLRAPSPARLSLSKSSCLRVALLQFPPTPAPHPFAVNHSQQEHSSRKLLPIRLHVIRRSGNLLRHQIQRPALRLPINPAHILTQNPHANHLHAAPEKQPAPHQFQSLRRAEDRHAASGHKAHRHHHDPQRRSQSQR